MYPGYERHCHLRTPSPLLLSFSLSLSVVGCQLPIFRGAASFPSFPPVLPLPLTWGHFLSMMVVALSSSPITRVIPLNHKSYVTGSPLLPGHLHTPQKATQGPSCVAPGHAFITPPAMSFQNWSFSSLRCSFC